MPSLAILDSSVVGLIFKTQPLHLNHVRPPSFFENGNEILPYIEAIVKVQSSPAPGNFLFQVSVGRRHNANIDFFANLAPKGSISFSCNTRNSLTCKSRGISPILSRNIVPSWAFSIVMNEFHIAIDNTVYIIIASNVSKQYAPFVVERLRHVVFTEYLKHFYFCLPAYCEHRRVVMQSFKRVFRIVGD